MNPGAFNIFLLKSQKNALARLERTISAYLKIHGWYAGQFQYYSLLAHLFRGDIENTKFHRYSILRTCRNNMAAKRSSDSRRYCDAMSSEKFAPHYGQFW